MFDDEFEKLLFDFFLNIGMIITKYSYFCNQ